MVPPLYEEPPEQLQSKNAGISDSGTAGKHTEKKIGELDGLVSCFGDAAGTYLKPSQRLRMSLEQVLGLGELSELERLLNSPYAKPSQALRTALNEVLDVGRPGSWDILFKELRAARWEAAALSKTIELVQSLLGSGSMGPETPYCEQTPVEPDSEPVENCETPSLNYAGRRRSLRKRASMNHAPLPVMNGRMVKDEGLSFLDPLQSPRLTPRGQEQALKSQNVHFEDSKPDDRKRHIVSRRSIKPEKDKQEATPASHIESGDESEKEAQDALQREEELKRKEACEAQDALQRQEELKRKEEEERLQREVRERQEAKEREEAAMNQARECLRKAMESILKSVDMRDVDSIRDARSKLQEMMSDWRDDNLPEDDLKDAKSVHRRLTKAALTCVLDDCRDVRLDSADLLVDAKEQLADAIKDARSHGMSEADLAEAECWRRKIHNRTEDLKGSIRVYCRVRPLSQKELDQGDTGVVKSLDGLTLECERSAARRRSRMSQPDLLQPPSYEDIETDQYKFDGVFTDASQEAVFQDCRDLIQSAFDGYNVTIFAYGQTGAGKTYTVTGKPDAPGLAPQMVSEIFRLVQQESDRFQHRVTCSMVELYKNELVDLLQVCSLAPSEKKVCVRQDREGNVQVENVVEEECEDAAALSDVLERGTMCRTTASTAMNSSSSRSHLIHTIKIYGVHRETGDRFAGKMLLVDLAGSERLKKSLAEGETQKEAIEINKSLTALGDVIEALTQGHSSVPYRNHKLTQVLQDALGRTAKTLMFVHCSPAKSNLEETLASLRYATRAKGIQRSNTPRGSVLGSTPRGSRASTPVANVSRRSTSVPQGPTSASALHADYASRESENFAAKRDSSARGAQRRGNHSIPRVSVMPPQDLPQMAVRASGSWGV